MIQDPIVKEIRQFRKAHSEKYDNDLNKIFNALKEKEKLSNRQFKNYVPREILSETGS